MRRVLTGLSGGNPLGFLGAVGLLRILSRTEPDARLGFLDDGTLHPYIISEEEDLAGRIAADAADVQGTPAWELSYTKQEKNGGKVVRDLKAPPPDFAVFLERCVGAWAAGSEEAAQFAAAYGTSTARDGKGNTKPTAFHFTAANQQFLGTVDEIRKSVTSEWAKQSLFEGGATRSGSNLRWDPASERNWALMASNPTAEGTSVDAPLEWMAFRGLPVFPSFPSGARILTTGVRGRVMGAATGAAAVAGPAWKGAGEKLTSGRGWDQKSEAGWK